MTDERNISRRAWFRLNQPRTQQPRRDPPPPVSSPVTDSPGLSMGDSTEGMQPVEQPVNHDGMDLAQLPPMREAILSADDVHQIFSDIAAYGSQILLMQRSTRTAVAQVTTDDQLRAAEDSLLSGAISRLQLRYHWQQQNWIDTLERREDGFRLVRIAHAQQAAVSKRRPDHPGSSQRRSAAT